MVLDSKINQCKHHFGIWKASDWCDVRPEWIVAQPGVGDVTLAHIRLYLAGQGLTLCDDKTPEYWLENLGRARIVQTMGDDEDGDDRADICPFTILIDSQEQHPFRFTGIKQDAAKKYRPLIVPTEYKHLGAAMGDYALAGYEGRAHVERKSPSDAASTILGWGDHRDRFERELLNLAQFECAAVVVESSLGALLAFVRNSPPRGKKTPVQNAKSLYRQILAWQQDYRVPWIFCDDRELAEKTTFRILERFWRKQNVKQQRNTRKERTADHAEYHEKTVNSLIGSGSGAEQPGGSDTGGSDDYSDDAAGRDGDRGSVGSGDAGRSDSDRNSGAGQHGGSTARGGRIERSVPVGAGAGSGRSGRSSGQRRVTREPSSSASDDLPF